MREGKYQSRAYVFLYKEPMTLSGRMGIAE